MKDTWIFMGEGASNPSAVFSSRELAEKWIESNQLCGMLTKYPVDQSVYDHSIEQGWFTPQKDHQQSSKFIQRFTSASMEHYLYETDDSDRAT